MAAEPAPTPVSAWKRARDHLRRYPLLLRCFLALRGRTEILVRPGHTALCIEGYPRSANSTTYRMFMLANPGLHVAHHTHTIANVALALRHEIPVLVLIRRPLDAICSALIASRSRRDAEEELIRYTSFYRFVSSHRAAIVVAEFQDVLADWNRAIRRVNERFGTGFALHADLGDGHRRAQEWIHKRYETAPPGMDVTNMPLPSAERRAAKEALRAEVEAQALYSPAQAVYASLLEACDLEPDSAAATETALPRPPGPADGAAGGA